MLLKMGSLKMFGSGGEWSNISSIDFFGDVWYNEGYKVFGRQDRVF